MQVRFLPGPPPYATLGMDLDADGVLVCHPHIHRAGKADGDLAAAVDDLVEHRNFAGLKNDVDRQQSNDNDHDKVLRAHSLLLAMRSQSQSRPQSVRETPGKGNALTKRKGRLRLQAAFCDLVDRSISRRRRGRRAVIGSGRGAVIAGRRSITRRRTLPALGDLVAVRRHALRIGDVVLVLDAALAVIGIARTVADRGTRDAADDGTPGIADRGADRGAEDGADNRAAGLAVVLLLDAAGDTVSRILLACRLVLLELGERLVGAWHDRNGRAGRLLRATGEQRRSGQYRCKNSFHDSILVSGRVCRDATRANPLRSVLGAIVTARPEPRMNSDFNQLT